MNVLGKFAKGVGDVVLGNDKRGPSEEVEVEKYLQRISDGVLPEDRREALAQLRDLLYDNAQAQAALGNAGFPVLCSVIAQERGDVEMLRGALECLAIALGHPAAGGSGGVERDGQRRGAMNAELFARGKDNVALLLGLLEEESGAGADFYVRYHAVQLLTCCAMAGSYRLQEAILAAPMGVNRLLGMMEEGHEVIRNEAILLLVGLTRASPELQKIAAFQGAFGRLLHIVREEGGVDGGIIVQDCMELLNNLLRGNPQTQLMFREEGHAGSLVELLRAGHGGANLSRQKAANLSAILDTFRLLLSLGPRDKEDAARVAARATSQSALVQGGAIEALLSLALERGGVSPPGIRSQALRALGLLLAGMPSHAERVMGARVATSQGSLPALQALLRVAVGGQEPAERAAADGVIRAFCYGNREGQSMLAATFMPIGGDGMNDEEGETTFGGELVRDLASPDVGRCGRAAAVLSHVLAGNAAAKERILRTPLQIPRSEADAPQLLLPRLVGRVSSALSRTSEGSGVSSHLLRTLVTWLQDCPPPVTAFLSTPSHLPFLLDIIRKRVGDGSTLLTGLAAVLLGECLLYNPDSTEVNNGARGVQSTAVFDIITSQLGLAAYFGCLDDLRSCPAYVSAAGAASTQLPGPPRPSGSSPPRRGPGGEGEQESEGGGEEGQMEGAASSSGGRASSADVSPIDRDFVAFLPHFEGEVRRRVMTLFGGQPSRPAPGPQLLQGETDADKLKAAQDLIQDLQREVEELRARGATLLEQAMAPGAVRPLADGSQGAGSAPLPQPAVPVPLAHDADSLGKVRDAEGRAAAAEAESARLQSELSILQARLNESESTVRNIQRVADEARGNAAKWEADLEDLSGAYAGLEKHAFELEERLRAAEEAAKEAAEKAKTEPADKTSGQAASGDEGSEEGGEADDGLNDLLICLGQEERKVEVLSARLLELGVDPEPLLKDLNDAEEEDADSGEIAEDDSLL